MRTLTVLAWLLGIAAMASPAFAWGDVGHRVICQIAYEELKPEIKARVDALVAIDPKFRTFADGCTWPDVFPRQRPAEHFVDLPRTAKGIDVTKPCPVADRCVISAILNDMRDLALSLDVSDQLRLLKSLGHWVGDVHQPLHVSFDDDRGGNLVAITGLCWRNLHAAWDSCLVEKSIGPDYERAAAQLRSEIRTEDRARWTPAEIGPESVTAWANESFAIATSPGIGYCVQKDGACWYSADQRVVDIDDGYLSTQGPIVRERLKAAAIRLAAILNVALTPGF